MMRLRSADNRQLRTALLIIVALVFTALAIVAYGVDLLASLEGNTVNTRFSIRGSERAPGNIVIVKIDPRTFQQLNLQWPFPRAVDGKVIDRIAAQGPAAIAFDVQTSEASNLPGVVHVQGYTLKSDDYAFLTDISNWPGKLVFSNTEPSADGNVYFLGPNAGRDVLSLLHARAGFGELPVDPGGVIRRINYSVSNLPSLAVVTAEVATHRRIRPRQFGAGNCNEPYSRGCSWIDFIGPADSFPSLSFSQVYRDTFSGTSRGTRLPRDFFRHKIVVIGATASNLQDIHATSTDSLMPGPEVQANAIYTVLRGFPLSSNPGWINVALIVVLGCAVPLAALRLRPAAVIALAVALGAVFTVAVQLAFNSGVVVSFVYPLGALVLSGVGSLAVQLVTEAFERVRVRDLFARFVPENVVDEVLASADGLRLGGVQRNGTVMFSDLRGFTTFAEGLAPANVIEVLNRYLSEMSDAILDHGGTLVAYMGDGIFAVFGAPLELEDHADRALAAAREMLEVRLVHFNEWLRGEGLGDGFRMGIGLNSGHVMSGHVGSERRVEYAAVGDTTNTASRIEGLTKGTPHQLLLSDSTRQALRFPPEDLIEVGETDIRGRTAKIRLWSLSGTGDGPVAGIGAPDAAAGSEEADSAATLQAPRPGV